MKFHHTKGFSLIELMIAVVIVGILAAIAVPSYQSHTIKASRAAAQTELLELASLQEKIYLNSSAYTASVTTAYTGNSTGGLGKTTGLTTDGKYSFCITDIANVANVACIAPIVLLNIQTYTIAARPVAGKSQENDGNISISENGQRLWGAVAW